MLGDADILSDVCIGYPMKRALRVGAGLALAAAAIIILTLVAVALLPPHASFLGLLNDRIYKTCDFQKFYAGRGALPSPREFIPELGALEDDFPRIQAEALAVFRGRGGIPRMDEAYNKIFLREGSGFPPLDWLKRNAMRAIYGEDVNTFDEIGSTDWRTFNLILYNRDVPGNAGRCPVLVRHLKKIPGMQSALLSILSPGGVIPPHRDPAKGVIRYHLAIKVPRDRQNCWIEVGGERYCWEEGRGVVFDDAFVHTVQNNTDEPRMILFVDILRDIPDGPTRALQGLANLANRFHPGVRRLIRDSRVPAP